VIRTVLVNAGPWLPVPPLGYGGIENVVAALISELRSRGVRVVLATVGTSTIPVDEQISVFPEPQFARLGEPYNGVMGVAAAHLQRVVDELRHRTDVDLVHDHLEALGPTVLAAASPAVPPVLHTLHWDLHKHPELYGAFDGAGRVFVNGVSASQLARAPAALRAHSVGHVHLATPLAQGAAHRPQPAKGDHAVVLARITPGKGQHIAARLAHTLGVRLVLAGPVGPYAGPADLARALATDPGAPQHPDVRYWCDQVVPLVDGHQVRWIGTVHGTVRDELVATARAMLCPVLWAEPGGTGIIEALSLGTPVVGFRRGCLPELVEDGTGLLTDPDDEDALAGNLQRVGTLDPAACRRVAQRRFTPAVMAEAYLRLYDDVLTAAGASALFAPLA
jgi:glycosyltransferase involved in cell wall biosynthesis